MKCELDKDINSCPFFGSDSSECKNSKKCSFQENKNKNIKNKYTKNHAGMKNIISNNGETNMKKTMYTTTRYDYEEGYYVEVSPSHDPKGEAMNDFNLCLEGYGIKLFMFGLYAKDCTPNEWEEIIENNIDDYIEDFEEHMECLENR